MHEKVQAKSTVQAVNDEEEPANLAEIDVAVAEKLTMRKFVKILSSGQTWLPFVRFRRGCLCRY